MENPHSSQNIGSYELAEKGQRIVAALIDFIIAGAFSRVPYIGYAISVGYLLTRDALPFLDGQSIGKKLFNLRAINEHGEDLTEDWMTSAIRNITLVIPIMPLVELIVLLTNDKLERLGDSWSKTKVILEGSTGTPSAVESRSYGQPQDTPESDFDYDDGK